MGRVDRKEGGWGEVDGNREGETGGGGGQQGQEERCNGEGDNVRRRWRAGQWGRWEQGGGKGEKGGDREGKKKGQEEGRFHRWI